MWSSRSFWFQKTWKIPSCHVLHNPSLKTLYYGILSQVGNEHWSSLYQHPQRLPVSAPQEPHEGHITLRHPPPKLFSGGVPTLWVARTTPVSPSAAQVHGKLSFTEVRGLRRHSRLLGAQRKGPLITRGQEVTRTGHCVDPARALVVTVLPCISLSKQVTPAPPRWGAVATGYRSLHGPRICATMAYLQPLELADSDVLLWFRIQLPRLFQICQDFTWLLCPMDLFNAF